MEETRVLLLRHAETSAPGLFHGAESDVGLGGRGFRQAEAVAGALAPLRPRAVYSSAMRRARETAQPIALACGLDARIEPELHERKMGPLSGLARGDGLPSYDETRRRWGAGEVDYTHEGGESYAMIRERVVPVLQRIARSWPGETVVVVAHGVVIRVLLASLLEGRGPADFDRYKVDNAAVNDLRFDGSRWTAVALNQGGDNGPDPAAW